MSDKLTPEAELQAILEKQRNAFRREGEVKYETRVDRLNRCIALLVDRKDEICEAVDKDFGGRPPSCDPNDRDHDICRHP